MTATRIFTILFFVLQRLAPRWRPHRPLPFRVRPAKFERPSERETMPKRPSRNKQTVRPGSTPKTVGDLMSSRLPALAQRARSVPEASEWHVAVMDAFGSDLANKVNGCSLDSGTLTVIAESSAWAARMRFLLADLEPTLKQLVPAYRRFAVRVRPKREIPGRP